MVRQLAVADDFARTHRKRTIFVFRSENAKAVYIFGWRLYANKAWNEPRWWHKIFRRVK